MALFLKPKQYRFKIGFITFITTPPLVYFLYNGSFYLEPSSRVLPNVWLAVGIGAILLLSLLLLIRYAPNRLHLIDVVYLINIIHSAFLLLTAVTQVPSAVVWIIQMGLLALALYFERITDWLKK